MSPTGRNEPMTKYLMFKVATRSDDQELAAECLETLGNPSLGGHEFLYACILDAQNIGSKSFAVGAMDMLVERHNFEDSASVHLPALIRCTIRLRVMELDTKSGEENSDRNNVIDAICRLFETGMKRASGDLVHELMQGVASESINKEPRDEKGHKLFTVQELNWFSSNSYALGRQHCEAWGMENTIRIFKACLSILEQYPADIPLDDAKDISLKAMCCHFVVAAALVSVARTEDEIEVRQQSYGELRKHIVGFDGHFRESVETLDADVLADILGKMATLLIFDFEGAVALGQWDDLREIVTMASECGDAVAYKAMADCLLRAQEVPGQVMFSTMRGIINRLSSIESMGAEDMARYIRCLFQVVLPLEGGMAFQLVADALQLVRESATTEQRLPDEELEWLATMSWNHAIDLYQAGKDEECEKWSAKAISLAHYCCDEGRLEKMLQDNFTKLKCEAG
ncbi:uncharacterized protein DNG_06001 [Cephalotrichum gorgonifer]|uniref:Uncharacterized protein n=1 Tax=Cephalotrichum gorgonifer TaxID=2041049 RepID=A0AAE8N0P4_9PEZI|nr:uncharacterized protein DNG_06001 [Cephalotrichum gorgonifer]